MIAAFNLSFLNPSLWWFVVIGIWFLCVHLFYFNKHHWILISLLCVSFFTWYDREQKLSTERKDIGLSWHTVTCHNGDVIWKDNYLRGIGTDEQGRNVLIKGKIDQLPDGKSFTIKGQMKYTLVEKNRNRYTFNAEKYWWSKGVVLKAEWLDDVQIDSTTRNAPLNVIKDIHTYFVKWFEQLPPVLRDYGETLLLGYTREGFYDDNQGIQMLGLVHLFSISGFQVTLYQRCWFGLAQRMRFYLRRCSNRMVWRTVVYMVLCWWSAVIDSCSFIKCFR